MPAARGAVGGWGLVKGTVAVAWSPGTRALPPPRPPVLAARASAPPVPAGPARADLAHGSAGPRSLVLQKAGQAVRTPRPSPGQSPRSPARVAPGKGRRPAPGPKPAPSCASCRRQCPPEATRGTSELPAVPGTWHLGAGQPRPPAARLLPRARVAATAAGAGPSLQGVPARVTCLQVKRLLSECHH